MNECIGYVISLDVKSPGVFIILDQLSEGEELQISQAGYTRKLAKCIRILGSRVYRLAGGVGHQLVVVRVERGIIVNDD